MPRDVDLKATKRLAKGQMGKCLSSKGRVIYVLTR